MQSLIINTFDIHGGAARAALRLHLGLQQIGLNSEVLVQYKAGDDAAVHTVKGIEKWVAKARPTIDNIPLKAYPNRNFQRGNYSLQWVGDLVRDNIVKINPDVINLHWTSGFIQIESLASYKKPLVWTLHDMWAFTGGCNYTGNCNRYIHSCGACPQLGSHQEWDLSRWVWHRKAKAWKNLGLVIVTPSRWLATCAKSSPLFEDIRIEVIPNSLDTRVFKPIERSIARERLNLPQDKQLILFGAATLKDNRKGLSLLCEALQHLSQIEERNSAELVIFGSSQLGLDLSAKTHLLGRLNDDVSLSLAYAAADVFIAPSTQDNLPNTVMESLACGTPCVAFDIGGMPDMIEHQRNGYLAKPFDTRDLAEGVCWILADEVRYQALCDRAREKVVEEFTLQTQAKRYSDLFEEVTLSETINSATHSLNLN